MLSDQRDLLLLTGKEMWCYYNMVNHHQELTIEILKKCVEYVQS